MQFIPQPAYVPMQQPMYPNYSYPSPYGMDQMNYNPRPALPMMQPHQMNINPANNSLPLINYVGTLSTQTAMQPAPLPHISQV
jgi:hypothetical protein